VGMWHVRHVRHVRHVTQVHVMWRACDVACAWM
jgi:hypothetical protein